MAFDAHTNLASATVAVAPNPDVSGTTLTVEAGRGLRFSLPPFNATISPKNQTPDQSNSEVVRVTARNVDTFTFTRTSEGGTARAIKVGDLFAETPTGKTFRDIESGRNFPEIDTPGKVASGGTVSGSVGQFQSLGTTPLSAASLTGTVADARLTVNVLKFTGGYPGGTTAFLRADGTFAAVTSGVALHAATHVVGGSDPITGALALTTLALTGSIASKGAARFEGAFPVPGTGNGIGPGLELGVVVGQAAVQGFNRTTGIYSSLSLDGLNVFVRTSGATRGVAHASGGFSWGDQTDPGTGNFRVAGSIAATSLSLLSSLTVTQFISSGGVYYPGDVMNPNVTQGNWYLGAHGSYGLYTNTGLYVTGSVWTGAGISCNTTLGVGGAATLSSTLNVSGRVMFFSGSATGYGTSALEIQAGANPRISFHWPGVVASQIGMDSSGQIVCWDNPGTGYASFISGPLSAYGTMYVSSTLTVAGALTANGAVTMSSSLTVAGTISVTGHVMAGHYIYPGAITAPGSIQSSWYLGAHSSYGLYTNTGLYVEGQIWSASNINAAGRLSGGEHVILSNISSGFFGTSHIAVGSLAATGEMYFHSNNVSQQRLDSNGDLGPMADNTRRIGIPSHRYLLIRGVTITPGDLQFENDWAMTEAYKVGIDQPGLAMIDADGALVAFFGKDAFYTKPVADVAALPYALTTAAERAQMDLHPELRVKGWLPNKGMKRQPIYRTRGEVPDRPRGPVVTDRQRQLHA